MRSVLEVIEDIRYRVGGGDHPVVHLQVCGTVRRVRQIFLEDLQHDLCRLPRQSRALPAIAQGRPL